MNCKPGDLAIVVKSDAGNEGKIVRCVRMLGLQIFVNKDRSETSELAWETDLMAADWSGAFDNVFADEQLRPIRDPGDDAQDETLSWLPVPSRDEVLAC